MASNDKYARNDQRGRRSSGDTARDRRVSRAETTRDRGGRTARTSSASVYDLPF